MQPYTGEVASGFYQKGLTLATAPSRAPAIPKPYAFGKCQLFGTIMGNQDWSTGFSWTQQGAPDPADWTLEALGGLIGNFIQGSSNHAGLIELWSADTRCAGIRAYWYPANVTKASVQAEYLFPAAYQGNGSSSLPTQTSLVVTLSTGRPGRSNRGRSYLPLTGLSLNGHLVPQAICNDTAYNWAGILSVWNSQSGTGAPAICVVAAQQSAVPITAVRVDNRPDIQRRRADKVAPTFYANVGVAGS